MMNRAYRLVLFFAVLAQVVASAKETKKVKKAESPKEVPSTMYAFRNQLVEMQPYIVSEEAFTNPKNEAVVSKHLENFATFSKMLKTHERLKTEGFQPNVKQIEEHFNRTNEIFKGGNKSFAWWLFRSSIHGCNQCHTQISHKQAPMLDFPDASISGTPFDQAEFWYAIRDYKRAMMFYNAVISRFGSNKVTNEQLRLSLKRIVSIALRIDRNPQKARDMLSSAKDHPQISKDIKSTIEGWIKDIIVLEKSVSPDPEKVTAKELEVYVEAQKLSELKYVKSVFVSGVLLEFINLQPKKVTPQILLDLGQTLEKTENDIFFTTSEHYYKTCVEKFSTDPVAKKCYEALEEKWINGFTGSSGTNLPDEYKAELARLADKLVAKKQKSTKPVKTKK